MICSHSCKHYQHTERTTGAANFSGGKAVRIFSSRIWCQTTTTCMWACMCYMHTHTHAHMCAHTHTYAQAHTQTHTHICAHTHTHNYHNLLSKSSSKDKNSKKRRNPSQHTVHLQGFSWPSAAGCHSPSRWSSRHADPSHSAAGGTGVPWGGKQMEKYSQVWKKWQC